MNHLNNGYWWQWNDFSKRDYGNLKGSAHIQNYHQYQLNILQGYLQCPKLWYSEIKMGGQGANDVGIALTCVLMSLVIHHFSQSIKDKIGKTYWRKVIIYKNHRVCYILQLNITTIILSKDRHWVERFGHADSYKTKIKLEAIYVLHGYTHIVKVHVQ